jgi:hypothetical protein
MSIYGINVPQADQIDYQAELQHQRVQAARRLIDPGDVLAVIDRRIAAESDPQAHPLFALVLFHLDRTTAVDGGQFYDRCKQLVLAAIDTCLDDVLEMMED